MILPDERARHEQQFRSVGPNAATGMVTGAQARGFMMQSGLPPMVLAQVWYAKLLHLTCLVRFMGQCYQENGQI